MNHFFRRDIIENRFSIISVIHETQDCHIVKIMNEDVENQVRTLKIMKKKDYSYEYSRMSQNDLSMNFTILKDDLWSIYQWRSPYIARIYDYCEKQDLVRIESEFVYGTNLYQYALNYHSFRQEDALAIVRQVYLGIKDYHKLGNKAYAHLKMSELMYSFGRIKFINCGSRFILEKKTLQFKHENYITEPELFAPEITQKGVPNNQSDVWSIGALYIVLMFWERNNQVFTKKYIKTLKKEENVPQFIKRCLEQRKQERIKFEQLEKEIMKAEKYLPSHLYIHSKIEGYKIEEENFRRFNSMNEDIRNSSSQQFKEKERKVSSIQGEISKKWRKLKREYHQIKICEYINKKIILKIKQSAWGKQKQGTEYFIEILLILYKIIEHDLCSSLKKLKDTFNDEVDDISEIQKFYDEVKNQLQKFQEDKLNFSKNIWRKVKKTIMFWNHDTTIYEKQFQKKEQIIFIVAHLNKLKTEIKSDQDWNLSLRLKNFDKIVRFPYKQNQNLFRAIESSIKKDYQSEIF